MSEERNEFTPDLFTLEDEDGNEQVFELLDVLEYCLLYTSDAADE